jgi:hypothetical protein
MNCAANSAFASTLTASADIGNSAIADIELATGSTVAMKPAGGKAAFEKALFVYPKEHLEMRQGARIILKSKEG